MADDIDNGGAGFGNRWRVLAWGGAAGLLLVPLVAMQFSDEVNWTLFDFIVFGAMLAIALGLFELAVRATGNTAYRAGVGIAVAGAFFTIWINGAVGIIGNETHPANQMFFAVLGVGFLGALIARFRPRGMVWAMIATAIAQVTVAVIAAVAGLANIFPITVAFAALWLTSAQMFRRAAQA